MNGSVGDRLRTIRGDIPIPAFSKRFSVSKSTLTRYEKGLSQPDAAFLNKVCDEFDICPTWLLTGKGPKKGFVAEESEEKRVEPGSKGQMVVSEDMLEKAREMLETKLGDRKSELSADKLLTLTMTVFRIYSNNFFESEKFRQDTLEKNVESLVKLALPEN